MPVCPKIVGRRCCHSGGSHHHRHARGQSPPRPRSSPTATPAVLPHRHARIPPTRRRRWSRRIWPSPIRHARGTPPTRNARRLLSGRAPTTPVTAAPTAIPATAGIQSLSCNSSPGRLKPAPAHERGTLDSGSSPEWRLSVSAAKPIPAATPTTSHRYAHGPTPPRPHPPTRHARRPLSGRSVFSPLRRFCSGHVAEIWTTPQKHRKKSLFCEFSHRFNQFPSLSSVSDSAVLQSHGAGVTDAWRATPEHRGCSNRPVL